MFSGMSQNPDRKFRLDPPLAAALGKVSPELAWQQVLAQLAQSRDEYGSASQSLLARYNLELDMPGLIEVWGQANPVRALNLLYGLNPSLPWRDLMSAPPLKVLEALLRTSQLDERLQAKPVPKPVSA